MEAIVKSIKLYKVDENRSYWKLELEDLDGNLIGFFGDPKLSDSVNFRKQTFGIMAACNCFNLLELGSNNPKFLPIYFEEENYKGVVSIINREYNIFHQADNGKYVLKKYNDDINKIKNNVAEIFCVSSASGVFNIGIHTPHYSTFYNTGQIYYGFGYPITISGEKQEDIIFASDIYKSFIESILKLYKTDDLLKMCNCDVINYPKILINIDENNNIVCIGNESNDYCLLQKNDSYTIERDLSYLNENIKTKKY